MRVKILAVAPPDVLQHVRTALRPPPPAILRVPRKKFPQDSKEAPLSLFTFRDVILPPKGVCGHLREGNPLDPIVVEPKPLLTPQIRSHVGIVVPPLVFPRVDQNGLQIVREEFAIFLLANIVQTEGFGEAKGMVEFGGGAGLPIVSEALEVELQDGGQSLHSQVGSLEGIHPRSSLLVPPSVPLALQQNLRFHERFRQGGMQGSALHLQRYVQERLLPPFLPPTPVSRGDVVLEGTLVQIREVPQPQFRQQQLPKLLRILLLHRVDAQFPAKAPNASRATTGSGGFVHHRPNS